MNNPILPLYNIGAPHRESPRGGLETLDYLPASIGQIQPPTRRHRIGGQPSPLRRNKKVHFHSRHGTRSLRPCMDSCLARPWRQACPPEGRSKATVRYDAQNPRRHFKCHQAAAAHYHLRLPYLPLFLSNHARGHPHPIGIRIKGQDGKLCRIRRDGPVSTSGGEASCFSGRHIVTGRCFLGRGLDEGGN
jgi:hypothetical protein